MCKNKIIKLEIKYASVPAKLETQDAIFKYSGRKRQKPWCQASNTFVVPWRRSSDSCGWYLSWYFLLGLCYSREKHFLTLQHVLLGNGQGQQPDVPDEGAPGLGSGERCFRWQWVVGLDHQVNSQQHQAQGEQALRGKTGMELITLWGVLTPGHTFCCYQRAVAVHHNMSTLISAVSPRSAAVLFMYTELTPSFIIRAVQGWN